MTAYPALVTTYASGSMANGSPARSDLDEIDCLGILRGEFAIERH